jgi:hypothetical protein
LFQAEKVDLCVRAPNEKAPTGDQRELSVLLLRMFAGLFRPCDTEVFDIGIGYRQIARLDRRQRGILTT